MHSRVCILVCIRLNCDLPAYDSLALVKLADNDLPPTYAEVSAHPSDFYFAGEKKTLHEKIGTGTYVQVVEGITPSNASSSTCTNKALKLCGRVLFYFFFFFFANKPVIN